MTGSPYPRPEGKMPRSDQRCPLCGALARTAHEPQCPWRLWAESPQLEESDRD